MGTPHIRRVEQPNALTASALDGNADATWLGEWEKNPRAIAFHAKSGFLHVGEHVFMLGEDRQRDLVLARKLEGSSQETPR